LTAKSLFGLKAVLQALLASSLLASGVFPAFADTVWPRLESGMVVLLRHASAPGFGDPKGFQIGDCTTQRNLDEVGRTQARRIGESFRQRGVEVTAVWSSQWCRTQETADLAFPGKRIDQPAFNSFFDTPENSSSQTRAARDVLAAWRGPGVLVVVTHQVNITALTGIVPQSSEAVVVKPQAWQWTVVGRITP